MSDKRYVVEKEFTYNDMPCVCVLNAMGIRCGYVGVDKNHPYFGITYDEQGAENIRAHWGLTFAGFPYFDEGNRDWWYFGFDCGHAWDLNDYDAAFKAGLISEKQYEFGKKMNEKMTTGEDNIAWSIKDVDFVEQMCRFVADQLEVVKNNGNICSQ